MNALKVFAKGSRKRIMVCVDNSRNAQLAFEYYTRYLHSAENEVIVLHVSGLVHPKTYLEASERNNGVQLAVEELRERNKALMKKYDVVCSNSEIKHKAELVVQRREGIGATIVNEAEARDVDLIVIGSRKISIVLKTIVGSISDYIVKHSHIPVLVCPASPE